MKFAVDLLQEMIHDPVAAFQGLMPGQPDGPMDDEDDDDEGDAFGDEDDEDDEDEDEDA